MALLFLSFQGLASPMWQTSPQDPQTGLSKEFLQPATSALISIHQAKQNIANVISKNLPIGYYDPSLAAQAYDQVRQSQIAATTNGDHQAATLLNSYFAKVKAWADQYKADRESMNASRTMGEDFLSDDTVWQAIQACEKGFNEMLASRAYKDIAECK